MNMNESQSAAHEQQYIVMLIHTQLFMIDGGQIVSMMFSSIRLPIADSSIK